MAVFSKRLGRTKAILASLLITLIVSGLALQSVQEAYAVGRDPDQRGGEIENVFAPAAEQYSQRAFPNDYIDFAQVQGARLAANSITGFAPGHKAGWKEIGPFVGTVDAAATYTGRSTTNSGRISALAISPTCTVSGGCLLLAGAAGGGIWRTENILAEQPNWTPSSNGIDSNATGSILFDPTDASGKTVYVGTGEPNGSSDSEAGVGLYKSTNGGKNWTLVTGSLAVSKDRSIAAIAVDPTNAAHIYIGTAVARHGSSSVNGGRFTPPDAPTVGLYESTDGGATFKLVFSKPSDPVIPGTANGADFFRGGVTKIEIDRLGLNTNQPGRVYFAMFSYGLFRKTEAGAFEQVFASAGGGFASSSAGSRTEFAVANKNGKLRIYLGDTDGSPANFYRVDDANVAATTLSNGTANPGWLKLSNPTPGTPGFASYNYCGGQCSYDMPVASPPGKPDAVWVGGQMQYDEIFTPHPPSNGRAIQRSVDAGVSFTDMTNDTQQPALGMHPDEHAIVFVPGNPDIAVIGSDGGVVRTSGQFANKSADCDTRGLSGAELIDCKAWLTAIPTRIFSLNAGLRTLQFQSVAFNPKNPRKDLIGGTQDNGTWAYTNSPNWVETVGGDGGQSGIDPVNSNIRVHSYYSPQHDVNFRGNDPLGWDYISDPLIASGEAASFYVPLLYDPKVGGTIFDGLQHVWRTKDSGGPQAYLDLHCNEITGDFAAPCGDWVPLGPNLTSASLGSKAGNYVVALARPSSNTNTLWAATRRGRVFISGNADAEASSVSFTRLDTDAQPTRFVSGIAVDDKDPNHAFVSFSGYNAYTPSTPGHVFEVRYNPTTKAASWTDLSYNLGDQPVTSIALDQRGGTLYVATDFGVLQLTGNKWVNAAQNLPPVAVYGLSLSSNGRVLYAATHGRGVFKLDLSFQDVTKYNILTLDKLSLTEGGSTIAGKVGAGGDTTFDSYSIANEAPGQSDNVITNSNLNLNGGTVKGNAVYGGNLKQVGTTFNEGSPRKETDALNLSDTQVYVESLSDALASLPGKAVASQYGGFNLSGNQSVNVFSIKGSELANANSLNITAPENSTVIVNIDGKSGDRLQYMGISLNGVDAQHVIYNFYEAKDFTINGVSVEGTILAPFADVKASNGNVRGSLVAKSLSGGSIGFENLLFTGDLSF